MFASPVYDDIHSDFYRAAWNADAVLRWDFCLSVFLSGRLSVRPSVCQTGALWQNGMKLCLDFYLIWKNIYPSLLRRRMFGEGRPLIPEILGQPARVGAKSPILNRYSLVAPQPYDLAKKFN